MEYKEEKGVRKKTEHLNKIQVTTENPTENIHELKLKKNNRQNLRRKPGSMNETGHPMACSSAGSPRRSLALSQLITEKGWGCLALPGQVPPKGRDEPWSDWCCQAGGAGAQQQGCGWGD